MSSSEDEGESTKPSSTTSKPKSKSRPSGVQERADKVCSNSRMFAVLQPLKRVFIEHSGTDSEKEPPKKKLKASPKTQKKDKEGISPKKTSSETEPPSPSKAEIKDHHVSCYLQDRGANNADYHVLKSESEMSSLIDDELPKKRRKKGSDKVIQNTSGSDFFLTSALQNKAESSVSSFLIEIQNRCPNCSLEINGTQAEEGACKRALQR